MEDTAVGAAEPRAVVLVEGTSDQRALETLAERRGRDLAAEGVAIVAIGGAQSVGRYLRHFGPDGLDVALAGLCDAGEEREFRRGLERAGLGADLTRADMESLGFYVCELDLEDELVRALGAPLVESILERLPEGCEDRTCVVDPDDRKDAVGLNVLAGSDPDLIVDHVAGVFKRIYEPWWGPRTEDIMRAACLAGKAGVAVLPVRTCY